MDNWPTETDRAARLAAEYKLVLAEVGEYRFRLAVDAILASRVYASFPTVAEFRGFIPSAAPVSYCGQCVYGYVYVSDPQARKLYQNDYARKVRFCECTGGQEREARLKRHYAEKGIVFWRPDR